MVQKSSNARSHRFSSDIDPDVLNFSESVSFDYRLAPFDIQGSLAHAHMLCAVGILSAEEEQLIREGLEQIKAEINSDVFVWRKEQEDVHMNIEMALIEKIGAVGKKLHTARSRNDQVALSFRLYVANELEKWKASLKQIIDTLLTLAEKNQHIVIPGYTHLQAAQPVSVAHHLLAYVAQFDRDSARVDDALKRVRVSPLGACALAGTTHPILPAMTCEKLGWTEHFVNAMDAVSDRDFLIESLSVCASIGLHLSRFCEDLILYNSQQYRFISLGEKFTTGSSIMPQKKNPDVAELVRGKSAEFVAALMQILTLTKALPMSYNRDMQEDKRPFLRASDSILDCLSLMDGMLQTLQYNEDAIEQALNHGFLNATEMADYLVRKGMPFREAYHLTGSLVNLAEKQETDARTSPSLNSLSLETLQEYSNLFESDIYEYLDLKKSTARRNSAGGTGDKAIAEQLLLFKQRLAKM